MDKVKVPLLQAWPGIIALLTEVSKVTGVPENRIWSKNRAERTISARYLFFYFVYNELHVSARNISRIWGCKHNTVLYAVAQVQERLGSVNEYYTDFKQNYREIHSFILKNPDTNDSKSQQQTAKTAILRKGQRV